jgi:hypothetical protein
LKDAPEWFKPNAVDMRDPESGDMVFGIAVFGAPIGSCVFERPWLATNAGEICCSIDKTTQVLYSCSAKAAHSVTYFSSLSLADYTCSTN